jgi:maleylpyruvate isomerase
VKVALHGYWRSSCSWRVRIALGLKDVPYEYVAVNLVKDGGEQRMEAYRARNPMMQVPLLEVDDGGIVRRLAQSMAILEWLDQLYPEPQLVPEDPWLAARARSLAEIVNSGIQPIQNLKVLQGIKALGADANGWAREHIASGLAALEADVKDGAGRYCIGDRVTLPDLFLVPQLYNARRFEVDLAPYPTLTRIERACNELPPFADAHPDEQPDAPRDN